MFCSSGWARNPQPTLARLLGRAGKRPRRRPDFVFYTGCNVLKTPHIALLALDIMDALGASYEVMGGPTHCCGVQPMRAGDVATFGRVAEATLDKMAHSKIGQVVSWCPACHVNFTETDAADDREDARRKAVRDDAVHALSA